MRLGQRTRRIQAKGQESRTVVGPSLVIIITILIIIVVVVLPYLSIMVNDQVPELEELLSIPAEALQKELCLSREEVCRICNHLSIYSWLLYSNLLNNSILVNGYYFAG